MFIGFAFMAKASYYGIDFLPDFVGYCLLFTGLNIAKNHCRCFDFTRLLSICGLVISAVRLCAEISFAFGGGMSDAFDLYFGAFYEVFTAAFTISLLISLYNIAKETDLPKLRRKALRNCIIMPLFWAAALFLNLNEKLGWFSFEASLKLPLVAQLLSVLWVVLVEINLFNCYARICLEGDEDMADTKNHRLKTPFEMFEKGARDYTSDKESAPYRSSKKKKRKKRR